MLGGGFGFLGGVSAGGEGGAGLGGALSGRIQQGHTTGPATGAVAAPGTAGASGRVGSQGGSSGARGPRRGGAGPGRAHAYSLRIHSGGRGAGSAGRGAAGVFGVFRGCRGPAPQGPRVGAAGTLYVVGVCVEICTCDHPTAYTDRIQTGGDLCWSPASGSGAGHGSAPGGHCECAGCMYWDVHMCTCQRIHRPHTDGGRSRPASVLVGTSERGGKHSYIRLCPRSYTGDSAPPTTRSRRPRTRRPRAEPRAGGSGQPSGSGDQETPGARYGSGGQRSGPPLSQGRGPPLGDRRRAGVTDSQGATLGRGVRAQGRGGRTSCPSGDAGVWIGRPAVRSPLSAHRGVPPGGPGPGGRARGGSVPARAVGVGSWVRPGRSAATTDPGGAVLTGPASGSGRETSTCCMWWVYVLRCSPVRISTHTRTAYKAAVGYHGREWKCSDSGERVATANSTMNSCYCGEYP